MNTHSMNDIAYYIIIINKKVLLAGDQKHSKKICPKEITFQILTSYVCK